MIMLFVTGLILMNLVPNCSYANEASDAALTPCYCSYKDANLQCQLYLFPGHLEGILFQASECKEMAKGNYSCMNQSLNFGDGSKLPHVACTLFDGKSTIATEVNADPIFSFLSKLVFVIMHSGDSGLKQDISKVSEEASGRVEAYKSQMDQSQAGIDAYRKAAGQSAYPEPK